ncbi:MAG: hypothetical protein IPG86_18530 [Chitinophagaceae bacterium]|nr:hypothetical protein [Chitinophagaceae bacterium]
MRKIVFAFVLVVISSRLLAQKGFDCEMNEVDSLLTPTERCIIECIKQLPVEKFLGYRSIGFFDSLFNCTYKKVILMAERKGYYYTTIVFSFTENLHVRLYLKELRYANKNLYNAKNKWDPKIPNKEIPFKLKIYHLITPFCEVKSSKD